MNIGSKILNFIKREVVLSVAWVLAIVSAFFIPPDGAYYEYLDLRTLSILFNLMCVMAGLRKIGAFEWIAQVLLGKVKKSKELVFVLVFLCFFFSMVITNDVALITFVPFTFTVLKYLPEKEGKKLLVPIVVLQTIAANLGSMLTPIGNPQNLYLYGLSSMSVAEFLKTMLPYTAVAMVGLVVCSICLPTAKEASNIQFEQKVEMKEQRRELTVYFALFLLCLSVVGHLLPDWIAFLIVIAVIGIMDKTIFKHVDYSLLATFVGFFVFIGNMGRIPVFCQFVEKIFQGNEILTGVVASQVISNVPAALLLSGFTEDVNALLLGTNIGGLGTLIASMASLISYKYVVEEYPELKGKYFRVFTLMNILFLVLLGGFLML